jgi:hypothetical protein
MNYRTLYPGLLMLTVLLAACGTPIAAKEDIQGQTALPTALPQQLPDSCPVTQPQDPIFVPPEPYPPTAPYGQFWYGTNELWTAIHPDGQWEALPVDKDGYTQKVFWWREGYDMTKEQRPQITVSGRRLDGDAPIFEQTGGTNGYHGDMGQFMLTGVKVPTAGCWELTGHYGEAELSFVVWVAPADSSQ